ncbi:MAG: saccharopine dehydrogenase C-terminal domain-containing protein [Verrucomicrobiota bacterium]|nr:saccharopine dehydrogenase C-terminal domain-containing protein [Verrucomicrobiota bacterium]
MKQTSFEGKVLFLGFGAVARCALPIFVKHIRCPMRNIIVMDFEDQARRLKPWLAKGVTFARKKVTRENLGSLLGRRLKAGDLLVDLTWNVDCCEILQWCHGRGVLYINTSVELWDPCANAENASPQKRTLYWLHMNIRRMISRWNRPGPTAVLEHGANPGLISHWTRQGLVDIAGKMIADDKAKGRLREELEGYVRERKFNYLARTLGVKVIHCSERDTQVSSRPKAVDEFVNTWSIEGFREEGASTAEMGWGTHEKQLPKHAYTHRAGPCNQICLARMGVNTLVRSWVPDYSIVGMLVRHGEAFTISDRLTVWEDDCCGGRALYRPTMHYAYCCCNDAIASLHELRGRDYALQPRLRIMNDEIAGGSDILGALIMGHAYRSWWTGSDLSIEESRRLVPHQNATTMQVAVSVVAACLWMLENREAGVKVPDDLPYDYILERANPYLGKFISKPSDWTPLRDRRHHFKRHNKPDLDPKCPWQFKNFLITDAD